MPKTPSRRRHRRHLCVKIAAIALAAPLALGLALTPRIAFAQAADPADTPQLEPGPAVAPSSSPAGTQSPPGGPPGSNEPIAPYVVPTAGDHAAIDNSAVAHDGHPISGYHNGLFFLRDHHDNFHLYIQGRMQIDFFSYAGAGVQETALKPTLFLRRLRPEITGDFLEHWRFMLGGDFGATGIDNPRGTNEAAAGPPGSAPTAGSARFAPAEATRFSAAPTDVFINYRGASWFNVMIGQFDTPFMLDNRTSDKYTPFMERALAVRAVGIPSNKEIGGMVWGETPNRLWFYSVGLFNGDGMNRPNVDSRGDVYGRTFFHPFATSFRGPLADSQLGGSFHYGSRDHEWVNYDYPAMTTQGAYAFWAPTYAGANLTNHIIPAGDQLGISGELRVPFEKFDFTGEFLWIHNNTREAPEGFQATATDRYGDIHGISYYAQLGFWPFGNRDINGIPGYGNPPRLDWSKTDPVVPRQALQLLAKWEQVSLVYDSASRAGTPDAKNIDGHIKLNALSFGANYWATKHVRLSLNYVLDMFPDSAPVKATTMGGPQQTSENRALAPGNTIPAGKDDRARDSSHTLHEILMRFAIAL